MTTTTTAAATVKTHFQLLGRNEIPMEKCLNWAARNIVFVFFLNKNEQNINKHRNRIKNNTKTMKASEIMNEM